MPGWLKIDGCHEITEPVPKDPDGFKALSKDGTQVMFGELRNNAISEWPIHSGER